MRAGLLEEIIEAIKSVRIAIVGDFCLDAYWFVDESKSEISVETALSTQPVKMQKYSLGGAGNVAANLAAMGVKNITAYGVIGNDPFGVEMIRIMQGLGISTGRMLVQNENWSTHVYVKPYSGDKEKNRIDFGNFNELSDASAGALINNLKKDSRYIDLIIINEQVLSGINTTGFRKLLTDLISGIPDKIFIADSRHFTDFYTGAWRKMNDTEACSLCGLKNEIRKAAKILSEKYGKPLFITRGDRGSLVIEENEIKEIPGLMILSRVDTVGAGDSYLAGIAAALAAGYPPDTAAELGTFVAGVTVQKLFQTGTATPQEIVQIGKDPDFNYNIEIAEDIRAASFYENSEIEIIRGSGDMSFKYAVFDNDGTVSTLREGWEQIMGPVMIKAILGDKYYTASEEEFCRVKARVDEVIDKTTGIQTLMQMKILVDLVKEFGYVPESDILDEFGYKKIFNLELLSMVAGREEKVKQGELSLEDLTIKNAVPFISELYNRGIKLYLTSGTDDADVRHEAEAMGYARFFEGGIHGSVGDIQKDAKKIVLDRLLDEIGPSEASRIVTFGDGPVEIRETHKRGGFTVGIASDEIRRYGLNHVKRTRLIKAGADIVVPDFSQSEKLLRLLNIR